MSPLKQVLFTLLGAVCLLVALPLLIPTAALLALAFLLLIPAERIRHRAARCPIPYRPMITQSPLWRFWKSLPPEQREVRSPSTNRLILADGRRVVVPDITNWIVAECDSPEGMAGDVLGLSDGARRPVNLSAILREDGWADAVVILPDRGSLPGGGHFTTLQGFFEQK